MDRIFLIRSGGRGNLVRHHECDVLENKLTLHLAAGQACTIVEVPAPGVFEVAFYDVMTSSRLSVPAHGETLSRLPSPESPQPRGLLPR